MRFFGKFLSLIWISQNALGGWTSGGGELVSNHSNPWFIQNTQNVKYCIAMDEENFGQTLSLSREKIKEAFAYWKQEFLTMSPVLLFGLKVATQNFQEVGCDQNPDMRFQLGVLSEAQKEKIAFQEHKYVGVAIRTEYDEVNLRGRGFIYIAPAKGPLALRAPGVMENPWEDLVRLRAIFIHELGHVFGLNHHIIEWSFDLMSEQFPDLLVRKFQIGDSDFDLITILFSKLPYMFTPRFPAGSVLCEEFNFKGNDPSTDWLDLLDIPHTIKCLKIDLDRNSIKLSSADAQNGPWFVEGVGTIKGGQSKYPPSTFSLLIFNSKQEVFKNLPEGTDRLVTSVPSYLEGGIVYKSTRTNNEKNFLLRYRPFFISLSGFAKDGKFLDDFANFPSNL